MDRFQSSGSFLIGSKYKNFINGVEVYSSKHNKDYRGKLLEMIKAIDIDRKLIFTIGRDGHNKKRVYMGIGNTEDNPQGSIPVAKAKDYSIFSPNTLKETGVESLYEERR
ncbi:MAG: hypothetical protein ACE5KE_09040 [Methanosarcinales archaeon]